LAADADPNQSPARPNRRRGWLVNLLLLVLIFGGVQWWRARPLATGEAPPLTGIGLDGRPVDLYALRGAPVLVHFWATWCPVCQLEQGAIDSIARDHPVVTVVMQSGDAAEVGRFMADRGLHFQTVADAYGEFASQWGVPAVPATFILDGAGRIAYSTLGLSTETGLRARLWAAGLDGSTDPAQGR
jgi:peroxiredoxin